MNQTIKTILLFSLILIGLSGHAQEVKEKIDYTPYELLSSYYNNGNFNPYKKGNWYVGLAFSLNNDQRTNTTGLVQNVIDGNYLKYDLLFKGGYYTGDYNMIGLNFGYFQNGFDGQVYQSPDTVNSNILTRGYTITPNLRTSIPLTKNQRFSFFIELDLSFDYSNTLSRQTQNLDVITKNYATEYGMGVGINPGLTVFAMEAFAFEAQLNIVGYRLSVVENEKNDTEQSREVNQSVSLDLNLLTLNLGLSYYIGANK